MVTLPRSELERMWNLEYLERLARTYWRYLTRVSLGLLRVLYTETSRDVVFLARPLVLLRFRAPEYRYEPEGDYGSVTWSIDRGILVAPGGRGQGYLRISVMRAPEPNGGEEASVWVASEVANFYPLLGGWGWFSTIGRVIYRATQLQIHVIVTHAFLRSLADLDLAVSVVGRLRQRATEAAGAAAERISRPVRR
jgi:hypothetical protein